MASSDRCIYVSRLLGAFQVYDGAQLQRARTGTHSDTCPRVHKHTPTATCSPLRCVSNLSNCHTHIQLLPTPTRLHCLTVSSPLSPLSSTGLHYQTHVLARHRITVLFWEGWSEMRAALGCIRALFWKQCKKWCKGWVDGACLRVCVGGWQRAAATGTNSHSPRSKTLWDIRKTLWIMRRRLRENKAAAAQITIDSWTRVFVSYSSFTQDQRNNQPREYLVFL